MIWIVKLRVVLRRIRKWPKRCYRHFVPPLLPGKEVAPPSSEQEFQARLLAVLERKPKRWVFAMLNSAFFLWILTASFLTIGSSYYTAYQSCVRDASQIADQFQKVIREEVNRSAALNDLIDQATSIEEIRMKVKNIGYTFVEFQNWKDDQLRMEYKRVSERIDMGPESERYRVFDVEGEFDEETLGRFKATLYGSFKHLKDDELLAFRRFYDEHHSIVYFVFSLRATLPLDHLCDFGTVTEIMTGARPKIVRMVRPTHWDGPPEEVEPPAKPESEPEPDKKAN